MSVTVDQAPLLVVRPKLKLDTVILESRSGAYLRNGDTAFLVKGKSAYRWLATLSPLLTGEHTVTELCDGLADQQRVTVLELIGTLVERGFAKDAAADGEDAELPLPVADRFRSQIEYIDHFTDRPRSRFAEFRAARVLVTGSGEALLAVATSLVRNGLAALHVATDDDPAPYLALAAEFGIPDGAAPAIRLGSRAELIEAGLDAIVYCADRPVLSEVFELTRRAQESGPQLLPLMVHGTTVVLGPVVGPRTSPCWLCAQLRLDVGDPATAADRWRSMAIGTVGAADRLDLTVARMIGNAAGFELFRLFTGALLLETRSAVVLQDLRTLEVHRERLLPHPACPLCAQTPPPEPNAPEELTDDQRYRRLERLFGRRVGVITEYADDELEQMPIKTARLKFAPLGGSDTRAVTAFHLDTARDARLLAFRKSIREYLAAPIGRGDMVVGTAAEIAATGEAPMPADRLATWSGLPVDPDAPIPWLPATDLRSGALYGVPAAAAYPFSTANARLLVERTPAGAAAELTRDEMIAKGLTSAFAYTALRDAVRGRGGVVPVDEDAIAADESLAFLVKSALRFGCPVQLYALPGAAPAHAVLAVADEDGDAAPSWSIAGGLSFASAARDVLCDVVGTLQAQHFEGSAPDLGAPLIADFDPRAGLPLAAETSRPSDEQATVPAMLDALNRRGETALLVDTMTPDLLTAEALVTGVVLIGTPGSGR
ncbi:TOMM precursor leader peptide-binding protein [Acrocarpospora macrocephala]|uniref:TOMM precursor leader peptide-binding protein n=1 Tax=Acrocarpospora macrocephala TaxID=150177 RepID=UPI00147820AE